MSSVMELPEHLMQLQRGYGWSQAQMAKELGISRPLLSSIYSRKRKLQRVQKKEGE